MIKQQDRGKVSLRVVLEREIQSTLLYFVQNLFYWIIYHIEHPFFEQYKVYDGEWPWKDDPKQWKELLRKSFVIILANNFIVIPITQMAASIRDNYQVKYSFEIQDLPDWKTIVWQMMFCMIIQDFLFSLSHWILHKPFFYKKIHKLHHQYIQTIGFSAEYMHPIEFVLGGAVPFVIPTLILGSKMHFYTFMIWGTHRITNNVIAHSGYNFPWIPNDMVLFHSSAQYHDYHHSHNVGNYAGLFTIWDTLIGANNSYYKYVDERNNAKLTNKKSN
ncbi:UNKNOWN [Stylonychia lemnae]|uniref:Fatty acid hydroxylase domain-containing protein n=1 Tax=Stylonychia lemnae TaxID=5949 RepID=A0A078B5V9_STYLE|nr:UNKNOWN [Stylonychia lemnae]|eukprot:CDW89890.1 UNKNOWN [Stylonychia lemnae]